MLEHAIAFVPTVVDVRDARRVGDRIYILLLIADDDGAALVEALSKGNTDELRTTVKKKASRLERDYGFDRASR